MRSHVLAHRIKGRKDIKVTIVTKPNPDRKDRKRPSNPDKTDKKEILLTTPSPREKRHEKIHL